MSLAGRTRCVGCIGGFLFHFRCRSSLLEQIGGRVTCSAEEACTHSEYAVSQLITRQIHSCSY